MQYSATVVFALAALASAKPTPASGAQSNAQQVTASIDSWLKDIETVNTFVDTAGGLKSNAEISQAATTAFTAAQGEGTNNDALAKLVKLDAAGLAANQALPAQFNIIGPAINDTISNPGNLQKNLDAINGARCPPPVGKGAISEEGAVQQAAAKAVGVKAAQPALPKACNATSKAGKATQAAGTKGKGKDN